MKLNQISNNPGAHKHKTKVGRGSSSGLGKTSGRAGFRAHLRELGHNLSEEDFTRAWNAFKDLVTKKKNVSDRDVDAIIAEELRLGTEESFYQLEQLQVVSGEPGVPTASVRLKGPDGQVHADDEELAAAVLEHLVAQHGALGTLRDDDEGRLQHVVLHLGAGLGHHREHAFLAVVADDGVAPDQHLQFFEGTHGATVPVAPARLKRLAPQMTESCKSLAVSGYRPRCGGTRSPMPSAGWSNRAIT